MKDPNSKMDAQEIEQVRADFKNIIENSTSEEEKKAIQAELDKFEKSLTEDNK